MNKLPTQINLKGNGTKRVIRCKVLQSPLAGVTDHIFRSLVRKWAPDALLFTEMVHASSIDKSHNKMLEINKEKGPIGVQIFDHCPQAIIDTAQKAEELGAFLIDINMGCPVNKVAKKGGGSGLLKTPYLAAEIVNKVSQAVNIPVSVKTRLGWDENSLDTVSFTKLLEEAGAQLLTLHGRTRAQGFSGHSNWDAIASVKRNSRIPVIANGDIKTPQDAIQCLKVTKADGVMIGRGILGSPWLIGQIDAALQGKEIIKTPTKKEKLMLIKEQLVELLESHGDHGLYIARKHIKWTCVGFKGSKELSNQLVTNEDPCHVISILQEHL